MAKGPKTIAAKIRSETLSTVKDMTTKEESDNIPRLYKKSARHVEKKEGPEMAEDGFLLSIDDPFAEGALRKYKTLTNKNNLCLPILLSFKDKNTKATLENYRLRACGGGDCERVNVVNEAIEKIG